MTCLILAIVLIPFVLYVWYIISDEGSEVSTRFKVLIVVILTALILMVALALTAIKPNPLQCEVNRKICRDIKGDSLMDCDLDYETCIMGTK